MSLFKIVQTDNFGGDYPDESFLCYVNNKGITLPLRYTQQARAQQVADALNGPNAATNHRYWKVVQEGYQLQPGFEP